MSKPIDITSAVTFVPSSYSTSSTFTTVINTGNGLNGSGNTSSYASFSAQTTSQYGIYTFDVSDIPLGATINSVACAARAKISSTNNFTTRTMQLYNSNTAMGAATTINSNTSSVYNLTTGTWTRDSLSNINLRIIGQRSGNQQRRIDFYGASLTVNYSISGTVYEITTSSEKQGSILTPAYVEVFEQGSTTIRLDTDDFDNIVVEDNGVDVTDSLEMHVNVLSGTVEQYPIRYASGGSIQSGAQYLGAAVGHSAESPSAVTSNTYSSNGSTGYADYFFNFSSIPDSAKIDSIIVRVYGHRESTSVDSTHKAEIQLYSDNTAKGTAQEFTSTGNSIMTLSDVGTWTREELLSAKVRFTVAYYGGCVGGITWIVNWSQESGSSNPYYYTYTLNNVSEDHNIVVKEGIIIPPEEDPDKTYYPITISSINATTDPKRGTVRVESGTSETIYIYPTDPQLTLAYDNGVDISSQLVSHPGEQATSAITTAPGASYGFVYSSSTGYYVSNNKGNDKTAAVCIVTLNLPVRCLVTFQYINYAEATYDFGVFGEVDTPLSNNYYAAGSGGATITDTVYKLACNTSAYNSSTVRTLTYEVESGEHTIYIKYSKDDATSSNNDTLQFRISSIEELDPNVYYTYNLNNISDTHSLIFIFGDVSYYFINSSLHNASTSGGKLYPAGQMVQLPGDNYTLTVVPDNPTDTLTLTDNGVDVTNDVERKEVEIVKEGVTSITVNFIYTITDIQTGHTLVALCEKQIITNDLYTKINNTWKTTNKAFKKNNDRWEEVSDYSELFIQGKIYVRDLGS